MGTLPAVAVGAPPLKPDVAIRDTPVAAFAAPEPPAPAAGTIREPVVEVAVATLEVAPAVFVEQGGRLIAVIEVVSPRNKDRPSQRLTTVRRYAGYLLEGVHLMVIDVHPRPRRYSIAERIEAALDVPTALQPFPPPFVATYRVGERSIDGGRYLAMWRDALTPGERLPGDMPLPLTVHAAIPLDLEAAYAEAAADSYLA